MENCNSKKVKEEATKYQDGGLGEGRGERFLDMKALHKESKIAKRVNSPSNLKRNKYNENK